MLQIETKHWDGTQQIWHVFYDKGYVYLDQHHHPPYLEKDIDKHLFTFDYNQIRLAPIVGGEYTNWDDLRGTRKDPKPFIVRGREVCPIYIRVRKYQEVTGWVERAAGSGTDGSLTDGMKKKVFDHYFPQLKLVIASQGFEEQLRKQSTLKVIANLREDIEKKRKFLDEIELILNQGKYKL